MDDLLAKFGWKKIAAILVIGAALFLFVALASLMQNNNPSSQSNKTSDSNSSNNKRPKVKFSTETSSNYSSKYYSFQYPSYYSVESYPQVDAMDGIQLTGGSGSTVKITVYDPSVKSLDDLQKIYIQKDYEAEIYPLGDQKIYEYFFIDEKQNSRIVQKVAFLQKDGKIIKLDFYYMASNPNYQAERDFVKIISSIN